MTSDDRSNLETKLHAAREKLANVECPLDDLKKAHKNLQEASWAVSQKAYQQGGSDGGSSDGGSGGDGDGGSSDEKSEEKKEEKKDEKKDEKDEKK